MGEFGTFCKWAKEKLFLYAPSLLVFSDHKTIVNSRISEAKASVIYFTALAAIDRWKEQRFQFSSLSGNDLRVFFFFILTASEDDVDGDAKIPKKRRQFHLFVLLLEFFFKLLFIFFFVVSSLQTSWKRISMPGDKIFGTVARDLGRFSRIFRRGVRLPNAVPSDWVYAAFN